MIKGYVVNNSSRGRHIFKQFISPGNKIELEEVYKLLHKKLPEDKDFVEWLEEKWLPAGWDVYIDRSNEENREEILAKPIVTDGAVDLSTFYVKEKTQESGAKKMLPDHKLQYAPPKKIDKLTAQEIANLKIKDNPKRILEHVNSVHKLRRAITICNQSAGRKSTLIRHIKRRIRKIELG